MEFRVLGRSGLKVSAISFGGMRVPQLSEEEAYKVINKAIDLRMNFFETAPGYGDSEVKIGKSLGKRRKDIYLSTKTDYNSEVATAAGTRKRIDAQLKRLRTDYLDFYQMWCVNDPETFKKVIAPGATYAGAQAALKEGLIKHIGLTSHAKPEEVLEFLKTGLFESVTIYYNAFQQEYATVAQYATAHNIGVVAMGPLNGGLLGSTSEKFSFLRRGGARTNAEGALRFIRGNPDVTTAIVGCASVRDVEEGARAGELAAGGLSSNDRAEITAAINKLKDFKKTNYCTGCKYCKECPAELNIWELMDLLMVRDVYGKTLEECKAKYAQIEKKADLCTECGACVEKCPQKFAIPEKLKEIHKAFS